MEPAPDDRPGGFIVLHRRIEAWPLWRLWTGRQRGIWVSMLLEANWKPSEILVKQGRVVVHRGEYITSQALMARKCKVSRKEIRTVYAHLEAEGAIQTRVLGSPLVGRGGGHQVIAVTISNYAKYQDVPDRRGHQRATKGPHQNKGNQGTSSSYEPKSLNTLPPSDTRAGSRLEVVRVNPDDVLSDWDHEQQRDVPRGMTQRGREAVRRGKP